MNRSGVLTRTRCRAPSCPAFRNGAQLSLRGGRRIRARSGLAPVELVLSLPILMLIMGLMIVFGTAASWKIRTETVSRGVVWQDRWQRRHHFDFHHRRAEWPHPAGMSVRAGEPLTELGDPTLRLPVVSGPMPGGIGVHGELLDFRRGVLVGEAHIQRRPSVLSRMGPYRFQVENPLLDDKFQFGQMGLRDNRQRRMPWIYDLQLAVDDQTTRGLLVLSPSATLGDFP